MFETIEVSSEVKRAIEDKCKFGETTHDEILRRILNVLKKQCATQTRTARKQRSARGSVTTQSFYRPYIIAAIKTNGGAMKAKDCILAIAPQVKGILKPVDFEMLEAGVMRWENAAHWERNKMVSEGILLPVDQAGHGIWKLAPGY